jgi:hypothetical protein
MRVELGCDASLQSSDLRNSSTNRIAQFGIRHVVRRTGTKKLNFLRRERPVNGQCMPLFQSGLRLLRRGSGYI